MISQNVMRQGMPLACSKNRSLSIVIDSDSCKHHIRKWKKWATTGPTSADESVPCRLHKKRAGVVNVYLNESFTDCALPRRVIVLDAGADSNFPRNWVRETEKFNSACAL
jgi:hypothetical protein